MQLDSKARPEGLTAVACAIASICVIILFMLPQTALAAGDLRVEAEPVECIPIEDNSVAWAKVENNQPDTSVRLYFRRLNEAVEDVYFVRMRADGGGRYWGVFPKAEDQEIQRHRIEEDREEIQDEYEWARWWKDKESSEHRNPNGDLDEDLIRERASLGKLETRHWMIEMNDETFQDWLEDQENEPAEYFIAVHDAAGRRLARTETLVTEVREDCDIELNRQQRSLAENLTVAETAAWQQGERVFHWLCDGIVTRLDPDDIYRPDDICRACIIAWWKRPSVIFPAAAGVTTLTGITILEDDDPVPVSPSAP